MRRYSFALLAGLALLAGEQPAFARSFRVNMIPNGNVYGCQTCHLSAGGGGPRNSFGNDVFAIVQGPTSTAFWSRVYNKDSDGDGFTNGQELGDPTGTGVATPGAQVTRPGDASSHPTVLANQPPTVNVTNPAEGTVVAAPYDGTLSANAADSDGTVAQVEFFLNGISAGVVTVAPYQVVASALTGGIYSLTATATDDKGATKTSMAVNFTVNDPPSVSMTSPTNGASFATPVDITLSADATDTDGTIAQIEFFEGANSLGVATSAPFTLAWSNAPAGSYNLTAAATDNQGAKTLSRAVPITVSASVARVRFDPIKLDATNVVLTWTGGAGPYDVQGKTNLTDLLWSPILTTTNRTVSVPHNAQDVFYRIMEGGAKP